MFKRSDRAHRHVTHRSAHWTPDINGSNVDRIYARDLICDKHVLYPACNQKGLSLMSSLSITVQDR